MFIHHCLTFYIFLLSNWISYDSKDPVLLVTYNYYLFYSWKFMNNTLLFYYYYNENTKLKYLIIEKKKTKNNRKLMPYLQRNVVSVVWSEVRRFFSGNFSEWASIS